MQSPFCSGPGPATAPFSGIMSLASRTLNSAFQVSATKWAFVRYSVQITITASIGSAQNGDVFLQTADDSGFTQNVQTVDVTGFGLTLSLAAILQGVQPQSCSVSGWISPNAWVKLVTVNNTGVPAYAYRAGQEMVI